MSEINKKWKMNNEEGLKRIEKIVPKPNLVEKSKGLTEKNMEDLTKNLSPEKQKNVKALITQLEKIANTKITLQILFKISQIVGMSIAELSFLSGLTGQVKPEDIVNLPDQAAQTTEQIIGKNEVVGKVIAGTTEILVKIPNSIGDTGNDVIKATNDATGNLNTAKP